ncbi:uncharacterized protein LOC125189604 isoform X2 [Salvia hispanica]|uniref:uncharacterized protein LOC125189604 isoform X2 n=1 Tax=Salvia hispanica TaxID=49212 RepID=UPI0020094CB0|nr:uncharacterized protein LOC125189604 isoform X2 [Salvia hispanica]
METHPTPFPVIKPRHTRKISEPPKIKAKGGSLVHRERRVFGTARSPAVPLKTKTVIEKPVKSKPASGLLKKPSKVTKPSQATRSPIIRRPILVILVAGKPTEKTPARPMKAKPASGVLMKPLKVTKPTRSPIIRGPILGAGKPTERTLAQPMKKTVCFQEKGPGKNSDDGSAAEPHTPLNAIIAKPRVATPFYSAEKCSKCRFDKLETASYWLSQIKLAESVGKHWVSATLFGLAFDCNAEPIRNLRVELRKYLARHEQVSEEEVWRKMKVSYGLVKEECNANVEVVEGGRGRSECKSLQPQR